MKSGRSATPSRRTSRPTSAGQFGYGDVWTWTAICADTKVGPVLARRGPRTAEAAGVGFVQRPRLAGSSNRIQLTSDGHKAVPGSGLIRRSAGNVDYSMLVKLYGSADGERRAGAGSIRRTSASGCKEDADRRRPGPAARLRTRLRRAAEPHDADANAAVHAAHPTHSQRRSRTTVTRSALYFFPLQLLPASPVPAD